MLFEKTQQNALFLHFMIALPNTPAADNLVLPFLSCHLVLPQVI